MHLPSIQDYAVIGDGRSTALVGTDGGIDWLCWPHFDSPSLFAALLDRTRGGSWRIGPAHGVAEVRRAYCGGSCVLRTRFETPTGTLVLTDFMPALNHAERHQITLPEHELIREVRCEAGEVEVLATFDPRPDYARRTAVLAPHPFYGLHARDGNWLISLRSEWMPLPEDRFVLRAGESRSYSLVMTQEAPAVLPPTGPRTLDLLQRTLRWWRNWSAECTYRGPYRDHVLRSALVLKLLQFAPSGAIVAAPTTSLPERPGGDLNWDYRFCWLRDASMTARVLFGLGYHREGRAFVGWLLHTTRLTRPRLKALYDLYGKHPGPERTLDHLAGWSDARPVRIGNAARDQLQLDIWGEVIIAASRMIARGHRVDSETAALLTDLGEFICAHGREPDEGIWEPRSGRVHHVHSRVLCWAGLQALLTLHEQGHLCVPLARFTAMRDQLRRDVEERGWNPQLGAYTETLDGDTLDAALLLMAFHRFEDANSPRMQSTWRAIRSQLSASNGLLYRYPFKPDLGPEGAFGICSFWAVELLAQAGRLDEAHALFTNLLGYANDLGLFAEEIDPTTGLALGNFPQAFTHVGLISAALAIEEACARASAPCFDEAQA